MPSKVIGFIDAGFLTGAGAACLGLKVDALNPNPDYLTGWLWKCANRLDARLLRAYWYDGIVDPKNPKYQIERAKFDALEKSAALQVRLGHRVERPQPWRSRVMRALKEANLDVEAFKEHFDYPKKEYAQKGVDTLIVLDLVRLAQLNAYDIAILIAGDRDLAEAIRVVQSQGKLVVVAAPEGRGLAPEIANLADEVLSLNGLVLRNILAREDWDEEGD